MNPPELFSTGQRKSRRGTTFVYVVVLLPIVIILCSFLVDYGRVQVAAAQLQTAADAGARAAAIDLTQAYTLASSAAGDNKVDGETVALINADVEVGNFDSSLSPNFSTSRTPQNAVRVTARRLASRGTAVPLYLAKLAGFPSIDLSRSSIAMDAGDSEPFVGTETVTIQDDARVDSYSISVGYAGSASTDAPIYGRDVVLENDAYVGGDVTYTNKYELKGHAVLSGTSTSGSFPETYAEVSLGTWATSNDNASISSYLDGTKLVVDHTDNVTLPGGNYYLTDLEVKDSAVLNFSGDTHIKLNGEGSFKGTSIMGHTSRDPSRLYIEIVSGKKGQMEQYSQLFANIYCPDAEFKLQGDSEIFGSVVSKKFTVKDRAEAHAAAESNVSTVK